MAMRMIARRLVNPSGEMLLARSTMRREMSSGKVFEEEEKAAENIYIKKMEQEKLEKLVRKGFTPEEAKAAASGSATASPGAAKTSTDATTNYAVVAGIVGAAALAYWYFTSGSSSKKEKEDKE